MKGTPSSLTQAAERVRFVPSSPHAARQAIRCLDYTNLSHTFNMQQVIQLCHHMIEDKNRRAASIIVAPLYVRHAYTSAARGEIRIGTVINRTNGFGTPFDTARETRLAVNRGADEIEIVLNHNALRDGDKDTARALLKACKTECRDAAVMRVVVESAAFRNFNALYEAGAFAIECGADMIATATAPTAHGKAATSPEAAATFLQLIKDHGGTVGLKIGGAPDNLAAAAPYIALTENVMGKDWVKPGNFRIGGQWIYEESKRLIRTAPEP